MIEAIHQEYTETPITYPMATYCWSIHDAGLRVM